MNLFNPFKGLLPKAPPTLLELTQETIEKTWRELFDVQLEKDRILAAEDALLSRLERLKQKAAQNAE